MMRVSRKQTLMSLSLSYPKKDWRAGANPYWPILMGMGMTPTIKYYSTAFMDYIL